MANHKRVIVLFSEPQVELMNEFCGRNLSEFIRDCVGAYIQLFNTEWPQFEDTRHKESEQTNDR